MKVIYHCYGGAHSSVVASAIHLQSLPKVGIPKPEDILNCAYFDEVPSSKLGIIHYLGKDDKDNDIYNMGCGGAGAIMEKALPEILNIYGHKADDLHMVDTLGCVNFWMRLGGFISRRLRMVALGRPLVLKGTLLAYPNLVKLVSKTLEDVSSKENQS